MANPIIRGFRSLTVFSGRDRRGQFWPYAGVVVALIYVFSGIAGVLAMGSMLTGTEVMPDFTAFFAVIAGTLLISIVLLAAAVSRRLHDTGKSALFGLMPVPFIVIYCAVFPAMMQDMMVAEEPDAGLFILAGISNLLYFAALITLIVLLCLKGTNGPNRFGDEPV